MKTILAALAAMLLFLVPVAGQSAWSKKDVTSLIRSTGCKARIVTSDKVSAFNSFYQPGGVELMDMAIKEDAIYIGTAPDLDDELVMGVALHEAEHCRQYEIFHMTVQDYYNDPVKMELDADRYAADQMCRLGYDGVAINKRLLQKAHDDFGYNGDEHHGTLEQRMAQTNNATACQALQSFYQQ